MATSILRRGSSLAASGTSSIASSSRLISKVASKQDAKKRLGKKKEENKKKKRKKSNRSSFSAYLTAQSYKPSIDTPTQFIDAIAKPRRGDLSSISTLLGEKPSWTSFDDLNRDKLKKGGVTIKERK